MAFSDSMDSIIAKGGTPVDYSALNPANIYTAGRDIRQEYRNRRASIKFNDLASQFDPKTTDGLLQITKGLTQAGLAEEATPLLTPYVEYQKRLLANNQASANVDQTNLANTKSKGEINDLIGQHFQEDVDRGNALVQSGVNPEDAKKYVKTWMQNRVSTAPDQFKSIAQNLYDKHAAMVDTWGQPQAPAAAVQGVKPADVGPVAKSIYQAKVINGLEDPAGSEARAKALVAKYPNGADPDQEAGINQELGNIFPGAGAGDETSKSLLDKYKSQIKILSPEEKLRQNLRDPNYRNNLMSRAASGDATSEEIASAAKADPKLAFDIQKKTGKSIQGLQNEFTNRDSLITSKFPTNITNAADALRELADAAKEYKTKFPSTQFSKVQDAFSKGISDPQYSRVLTAYHNYIDKISQVPGFSAGSGTAAGINLQKGSIDLDGNSNQVNEQIKRTYKNLVDGAGQSFAPAGAWGKQQNKAFIDHLKSLGLTGGFLDKNNPGSRPGAKGSTAPTPDSGEKVKKVNSKSLTPAVMKSLSGKLISLDGGPARRVK